MDDLESNLPEGASIGGTWKLDSYLDEHHLVKELHAGAYGRFHKAIAPLETIIPIEEFKLPRLIVIGNQHRGKSSLLESITKSPVFPRGRVSSVTTTRAPVCLQMEHVKDIKDKQISVSFRPQTGRHVDEVLQSESDIVGVVQRIMDSIDRDTTVSDEVVVTIRSPEMTTIEFVDLPGIVADPPEKAAQTDGLVQKYLADPRNLVLCVEEASCGDLDSTQAVGRVRAAGRTAQTIMVLTQADLVDAKVMGQRLWKRVQRSSHESFLKDFVGCVAVINSNHHIQMPNAASNINELEDKTFEQRVFSKRPNMPQLMHLLPAEVRDNLTISNLIAQVERMYRKYIIENWQPAALDLLKPKVEAAKQKRDHLGCPVGSPEITLQKVMWWIWSHLDWAKMVRQLCHTRAKEDWTIYTGPEKTQAFRDLWVSFAALDTHAVQNMLELKAVSATALCSIECWLEEASYLTLLQSAIAKVFKSSKDEKQYRVVRFQSLKQEIIQGLQRLVDTKQIKTDLMADLRPIAAMLRLRFSQSHSGFGCLQDMEQAAHTAIIQEVFGPLQKFQTFVACVPNDFPLEESPFDQQLRADAVATLSNLQHALGVITYIHVQVDRVP